MAKKIKKQESKKPKGVSHISIARHKTIRELLILMESNVPLVSGVPSGIALVVDALGVLEGIVTDGDVRRGISKGLNLEALVQDVMNPKPLLVEGMQSPQRILSFVSEKTKQGHHERTHFDKLVVVDESRRPITVLSLHDLLQASDVRFKQIGVLGLGYVGLTLAVTLADLGFNVQGYDKDPEVIKATRAGEPRFFEQGLPKLVRDHVNKRFQVVESFDPKKSCDVYFVAVGTPIGKDGLPSLKYIVEAAHYLGTLIKKGDLIVLRSTVPMGTTRSVVVPLLEKESGLKAGEDFLVAFAPERTIEGKALEELRRLPQVIGGINHASAEVASNIFSFLTKSVVLVDSLEEAEMVKLLNNTYRAVTFAFANEMSLIAKRWGLDTKRVIDAANFGYERSKVPLPSPGVGGYCLEKDPTIFLQSAREKGYEPHLIKHTRSLSEAMLDSLASDILSFLKKNKIKPEKARVCIIGFAFKGIPVTSDVRGSTTYGLIERLKKAKIKTITGYDPYVRKSDITKANVAYLVSPEDGVKKSDVVVVMNNSQHFAELDMRGYLEAMTNPTLLVDAWNHYPQEDIAKMKHVTHYRL